MKPAYLVCVTGENNNKYYTMIPNTDNTFTVKYGRVGGHETTQTYSMSDWSKKYNEKLRKGYADQTSLYESLLVPKTQVSKPEIAVSSIREVIQKLMNLASKTVSEHYTVKAGNVTEEMVDRAQEIINTLTTVTDKDYFNRKLTELFTTLPRKMEDVRNYLITSMYQKDKVITREQDLLDVMRGQITTATTSQNNVSNTTILEDMGITMEECTDDEIRLVKACMNESKQLFNRCWKVTNIQTQKLFDEYVRNNNIKDTKLLFHGSRSENWISIMKTGLKIRPSNAVYTGSMFGDALYFAPKCQKSVGYTSLSGSYWANGNNNTAYMALFETAYGDPYNVYSFDSKYYSMSYNKLPKGKNCLHAHAGNGMLRNDEIVYYKPEQVTIKYLIEIAR